MHQRIPLGLYHGVITSEPLCMPCGLCPREVYSPWLATSGTQKYKAPFAVTYPLSGTLKTYRAFAFYDIASQLARLWSNNH